MEIAYVTPPPPLIESGDVTKLLATVREYMSADDLALIERAHAYAAAAHAGKYRYSGDPYIVHPIGAAQKLADMRLNAPIIAAGLLHDVIEDAGKSHEEIARHFGKDIAFLVKGVTKVGIVRLQGEQRYIENLRRMFVAMAEDIRVIIIKFCDRLHNLETLAYVPERKRMRIARESLEIHAPIANRLGMMEMKAQLEDLAFPHVYPAEATWVVSLVASTYGVRRERCSALRAELAETLTEQHVPVIAISARMKHQYSLYQKLLKHDRDIGQIYDIAALRIIVPTVADCYAALGVLHQQWKPLKGRIKDYIANPKPNGYRSIHTTATTGAGDIVEFQIRTEDMHEDAEWGAAATWRYHERGVQHASEQHLRWVKELVEWQRSIDDPQDFLAGIKTEVLRDRILVFTPKGDVIDLPESATPLDFAYEIHTDVGNTAVGARVNGHTQLHPLDAPLKNGDLVEIITDAKRKGPSPDWLHVVKTTQARSKIKDALRGRERATAAGRYKA